MTIVKASKSDIPHIVEMGAEFHKASGMKCGFNPQEFSGFVSGIIDQGVIFKTDHGMIGGVIAPAYCDHSHLQAIELFWWAEKGGVALLRTFEEWALDNKANEIRMTTIHRIERPSVLLGKLGYSAQEISYGKAI